MTRSRGSFSGGGLGLEGRFAGGGLALGDDAFERAEPPEPGVDFGAGILSCLSGASVLDLTPVVPR
jgi:hypothetical protein